MKKQNNKWNMEDFYSRHFNNIVDSVFNEEIGKGLLEDER